MELNSFQIVAEAARKTNELEFLTETYRNAIEALGIRIGTFRAVLEQSLATLYYDYTQEQKKAVRIWKDTIEMLTGFKEEELMGIVRMRASISLLDIRSEELWMRALAPDMLKSTLKT